MGYFARVKNSIAGFLFGLVLFLLAIPFLAWNENNVYKVRMGLKEGAEKVQSVSSQPDRQNDGRLVHIHGRVETSSGVEDPVFDLSFDALRLSRKVEMYQWDEDKRTKDGKTRYSYDREWSERHIDSSRFHESGHDNPPPPPYSSEDYVVRDARLGGFGITQSQIREAGGLAPVADAPVPLQLRSAGWSAFGNVWFKGRGRLEDPQIGDVRVTFNALGEADLSLAGKQQGDQLQAWTSSRDTEVMLVELGDLPAKELFERAQSRNTLLGWALRAAGFAAMWIGLSLCFNPLAAVLSFIPGVGGLVSMIGRWITFIIAALFALTTVVVSWVAVRPMMLMLVIAGVVVIALIIGRLRGDRAPGGPPAAPPPSPPPPPPGFASAPPPPPPAG
ncbi:MAG: TMEM43 family protein, partial [Xanthomonadales bacterium]|nr:TMEM43 family protein [Xanthomonadales bacterium]